MNIFGKKQDTAVNKQVFALKINSYSFLYNHCLTLHVFLVSVDALFFINSSTVNLQIDARHTPPEMCYVPNPTHTKYTKHAHEAQISRITMIHEWSAGSIHFSNWYISESYLQNETNNRLLYTLYVCSSYCVDC